MPRQTVWPSLLIVIALASACDDSCLFGAAYACDQYSDIATCSELEFVASLLPQESCDCSTCTCNATAVAERLPDCPMSEVKVVAHAPSIGELRCIHINFEPGHVEKLNSELVVSRAAIRGKAVIEAAPNHRVVRVLAGGDLSLEAVELRNGFADRLGGGCVLLNRNATLQATDVVFTNCTSVGLGGAILGWTNSRTKLMGQTLIHASSAAYGGAVYVHDLALVDVDSGSGIFSCFAAQQGGGIAVGPGALLYQRGTIATCHAGSTGGAVAAISVDTHRSLIHVRPGGHITYGSAGAYGGCIGGDRFDLILDGANITDCVAIFGAAAFFDEGEDVLVTGGTRVGRSLAYTAGGGFFVSDDTIVVIEQSVIHDCRTLFVGNFPPVGGGIFMWPGGSLTLTEGAEIRDCAAAEGGGAFVLYTSELHLEHGALIRDCYALISGGGIFGTSGATIDIQGAATGIKHCAAEISGGGIMTEGIVDITLIAGHVSGNIVVNGDGGGLDLSSDTKFYASSGARINENAATEGGGLKSHGLVVLSGHVDITRNTAMGSGGGAHMIGGDARLVQTAEGYGLVDVILDGTSGTTLGYLVIYEAHDALGARPYDATGASTEVHIQFGNVTKNTFSFARGTTYEVRLVSSTSEGWPGSRASYTLTSEIGFPFKGDLSVDLGQHATSSFFELTGSASRGRGPAFIDNRAHVNGGGIALVNRASAYGAHSKLAENWAAQSGGSVFVGTLCSFDAVGFKFENNSASNGGALHTSTLSTVYLKDTVAMGNAASEDGGFAVFDTVEAVAINRLDAVGNSAAGNGGAISTFRAQSCMTTLSNFIGNEAGADGAAVAARDTEITIVASTFYDQLAGGDGTIASIDATVIFKVDLCIPVDLVLDMTRTSVTCSVVSSNRDDVTCDFYPQGCMALTTWIEGSVSCDGCGCHYGGERYVAVFDQDGEEAARVFLHADAVRTETVCLPPASTYHLQGFDLLGKGWEGGTVQAFIDGTAVTPLVFVDKFQSDQVPFVTSEAMRTLTGRNRVEGGGGFVFWTTSEPAFVFQNVLLQHDSIAGYGPFVASPPISMRLAGSNGTYVAASGESVEPIAVELVDIYGTVVTTAGGYTAIVRLKWTHGFIINNLAEFSPRAEFRRLAVFDKPGAVLPAIITSEIATLAARTVDITVALRSCSYNEYEEMENTSGYSTCNVCDNGEYLDPVSDKCLSCSKGMSCQQPGNELSTLLIKAGWYRTVHSSKQVYACRRKDACPESTAVGLASCAEGHVGMLCGSCAAGWFQKLNRKCVKCRSEDRKLALGLYSTVFTIFFTGICWIIFTRSASKLLERASEARVSGKGSADFTYPPTPRMHCGRHEVASNQVSKDTQRGGAGGKRRSDWMSMIVVKLKAILAFMQIVAALPSISLFQLHNGKFAWLWLIGSFVTMSLQDLLPGQCVHRGNAQTLFMRAYVVTTTFPVALALFLVAGYHARTFLTLFTLSNRRDRRGIEQRTRRVCTECMLLMMHLMLPALSTASFLALVCLKYDFGDEQKAQSYMRVAPTISCSSKKFTNFLVPWSMTCIFVYPIGVPAFYMALLWRNRAKLYYTHARCDDSMRLDNLKESIDPHELRTKRSQDQAKATNLAAAYQFLWIDYRHEYYYFEVVDILRRILLTACLAVIAPGRPLQLLIGYVVSSAFTLFTILARPFADVDDNIVSISTQVCTTGSLFVFFLLRISMISRETSNLIVVILAFIPLIFLAFALRWFCVSCVCMQSPRVSEATDDNGTMSNSTSGFALRRRQDCTNDSTSDDECVSPKSDVCLMLRDASDPQREENVTQDPDQAELENVVLSESEDNVSYKS